MSEWTLLTLKEYLDRRFEDSDKAVQAALTSAKEAVKLLNKLKQIWYNTTMSNLRGENNNNWRGDNISIKGIHVWLKSEFGSLPACEMCGKIGKKVNGKWNIQWAKLRDKEYERKRENFWGLCAKCHTAYDDKCPAGWNKGIPNSGFKKGYTPWNKGKNLSPETIAKMQGRIPWNKGLKANG